VIAENVVSIVLDSENTVLVDVDVISEASENDCPVTGEISNIVDDGLSVDRFVSSLMVWDIVLPVPSYPTVLDSVTVRSEEVDVKSVGKESVLEETSDELDSVITGTDVSDIVGGLLATVEVSVSFPPIPFVVLVSVVSSDDAPVTVNIGLSDSVFSLPAVTVSTYIVVDEP
jgi:hypothetical protein